MGEEKAFDDDLLRVSIVEGGGSLTVGMNFSIEPNPENDEYGKRFARQSHDWTSFCISFFEVVPMLASVGFAFARAQVSEEVVTYLREQSVGSEEKTGEDGEKITSFIVHEDDAEIVLRKSGQSRRSLEAARAIRRSTLGTLISEYEHLMNQLLRIVADIKPELFFKETDSVHVYDVMKYSSITEFQEEMARQAVDRLLSHSSHMELLDWISKNLGINADLPQPLKKDFVEVCQRRHLLMHNGGLANKKYIDLCVEAGNARGELGAIGERLDVDINYLRSATARVFQVGFFVLHMFWQKFLPNEMDDSLSHILSRSHDFLDTGLTKMCRRVIEFGRFQEKKFSNQLEMYFRINEALSYLHEDGVEERVQLENAERVLKAGDWSVTTPTVDLALACVKRDFEKAFSLAPAAAQDGVTYQAARTWAVFKEARARKGFLENFPRTLLQIPSDTDV